MNRIGKTITTVEIAEMMETEHSKILRKLEGDSKVTGIIPTLTQAKIGVSDYFTESTYKDTSGKENKCYKVTKLGCDFLANKFTGEKGILFTAKYVKRFAEMEEVISKPIGALDELNKLLVQGVVQVNEKVESINQDLQTFKQDMPLLALESEKIVSAVKSKGVHCLGGKESNSYQDKSLIGKVYSDIYGQLKRQFGVATYKAIKRNQCDLAIQIIKGYTLPFALSEEIQNCNNQMGF